MSWQAYIDTSQMFKPFLRDTGKPIERIFEELSHGHSIEEILKNNSGVTVDHLRACFAYVREIIPESARRRHPAGAGKVHVSRHELEKAFRRHAQVGGKEATNDSGLLLLIYAVECGLKCLLLKKRGVHSTERLEKDDLTHDLNQLLKAVGSSPRFGVMQLDGCNEYVEVEQLHQTLRYGIRLQERARILKIVTDVVGWLGEEIS